MPRAASVPVAIAVLAVFIGSFIGLAPAAFAKAPPAPAGFTRKVRFEVRAPNAREVFLRGRMAPNDQGLPMRRGDDWRFWALVDLAPGRWEYVFSVDGKPMLDELADGTEPDGRGGQRAFVEVLPESMDRLHRPDPKVRRHGKIVRGTLQSAILGAETRYALWLPPGFDARRRYPVLWLLHGFQLDENSFIGAGIPHLLDNLLAQRRIAPFIVVMPSGGTSWWRGDVERYLVEELAPHLGRTLPIGPVGPGGPVAKCHAVAGTSMGGFGALWLGWRHPELFGWVDALSAGVVESDAFLAQLDAELPQRPYGARLAVHCGKQDMLYPFNRDLGRVLEKHRVAATISFTRGEHNFDYWRPVMAASLEDLSRWFAEGCAPAAR